MKNLKSGRFRIRFLLGLALLMFVAGLFYGVVSGDLALSAAKESDSSAEEQETVGNNGESSACLSDPSVLEELRTQRESVVKAQKDLALREQELKTREQAVAEELKKLQAVRDEISKTELLRSEENQQKVAKVIETVETMSPKASAKMFAELDDALAVEVLMKMDTAKLAKIMNLLEPKRASKLTEILAGVTRSKTVVIAPPALASAETVTGRDVARNHSSLRGGENNNDGKNKDSSNNSSGFERKPSSVAGLESVASDKGGKTPGTR